MRRTDRPGGQLLLAQTAIVLTIALLVLGCSKAQDTGGSGGASGTGPNVASGASPDITKPQTGTPKPGGKLVYGLEAETDGWDPSQNRWAASGTQVAFAVYDPLMGLDKDFNPKPILAESMLAIDGFQTWNLTIRKGIKFHNGQDLNAAAVKKALDAVRGGIITGAAMKPILSIEQTGEFTIQFKVREPWATFPSSFTAQLGVIPAPEQLDNKETAPTKPIGTGPFVFKEWIRDAKFVATKNPTYWQKGLPYLDEVEFRPIPDVNSRFTSLQSGDINLMTTTQPSISKKIAESAKAGELQMTLSRGNNDLLLILMNTSKAPFDDPNVRKAMAYALDRKALAELDGTDPAQIADSVFQPDSFWYAPQPGYPNHDPEKAKQLVQEYVAKKGPIEFSFNSTPDSETLRPIQAIAEQFKAVGITVNIRTMDQPTFVANAVTGNYEAQIWRQFGSPDPDGNYIWFIGDNADGALTLNMARYKNPKIDQAMKDGRATIDLAPRKDAYNRLQAEQTASLPYLWLSHTRWVLGADVRLRGLQGSPLPDGGGDSPGMVAGIIGVTTMWFDK